MKKLVYTLLVLFLLLNACLFIQTIPTGFSLAEITNGFFAPTVFNFAPNRKILVQPGLADNYGVIPSQLSQKFHQLLICPVIEIEERIVSSTNVLR